MSNKNNNHQYDPLLEAAHELKTPIAAVRGFLELVQQAGPLNELQLRYLDRAFGGLNRMAAQIASLLESDGEGEEIPLHLGKVDLLKLSEDAVELIQGIAQSHGITIEINIPEASRYIEADSRLIGQVMNNLLSNAVKYSQHHGWVRIASTTIEDGIEVSVTDNGIGIPPEDHQRIFEPYFRASSLQGIEGNGLGLSIVTTIIRQHGGRIWVESEPGKGSAFLFILPNSRTHDPEASQPGEIPDPVDDNQQEIQ